MPGAERSGLDGFPDDLRAHRIILRGRVAGYVRIIDLLLERLEDGGLPPAIRERFESAWRERRFNAAYDRPALLLAALRADALVEGPAHPLHGALAADEPDAGAVALDAIFAALSPARERLWAALATRRVQTNETARAVAWLWPAALAGAGSGERPLALVDLGASAGLNLAADALPAIWTDSRDGSPLRVAEAPRVVSRLGLDARPIDAEDDAAVAWLRACLWPGERRRLARFEAAIAAFRAARRSAAPPVLEVADLRGAGERLRAVARAAPADALVVAYQTLVREYLAPAHRTEYVAAMRDFLASSPPRSALWVELEMMWEGSVPKDSILEAHARGKDGRVADFDLARCGYHPVAIAPNASDVAALEALFRP